MRPMIKIPQLLICHFLLCFSESSTSIPWRANRNCSRYRPWNKKSMGKFWDRECFEFAMLSWELEDLDLPSPAPPSLEGCVTTHHVSQAALCVNVWGNIIKLVDNISFRAQSRQHHQSIPSSHFSPPVSAALLRPLSAVNLQGWSKPASTWGGNLLQIEVSKGNKGWGNLPIENNQFNDKNPCP